MQRKNNLLRNSHRGSRNAIAMIMAMAVIVIIATIMALSLSLTSQTTKQTNDLYLHEQALLYAKSATEYALLRIAQDNTRIKPCNFTNSTFTQDSIYNIAINVRYVYSAGVTGCPADTITVVTPDQNGSALIDVVISVTDTSISSEPIRYFRRTIQKL